MSFIEELTSNTPNRQTYMQNYYQKNKKRLNKLSAEYNRTHENYKKWKKNWTRQYEKNPIIKERRKLLRQTSENYKINQKRKNKAFKDSGRYQIWSKEYRKKNKEKLMIKNKKHYQTHPEIYLRSRLKSLKRLAEKFNLSAFHYQVALLAWSKSVKKEYNNLCQVCLIPAEHSHHILHKAKYPELSLNTNNGIPLCKKHHHEVHGINLGVI